MTPQAFNTWLTTPNASRVLLLELEHADGTEYVSNAGYIGEPVTRDNQHRQYEPVLAEAVGISDRLDGELSIGDITLINDGLLNTWLGYKWRGFSIRGYLGAPDWPRDDFQQVLIATNAGVQSAGSGELILGVVDARDQLDKPLTTDTVNGLGAPVVFGQVFNITPAVVDPVSRTFMASVMPLSALNAADRGNLGFVETANLASGEFTTSATAQGTVTVDATGTHSTAAGIARQVAALYNVSVDDDSLNALPAWSLGFFYSDGTSTTGANVLDDICNSIGGYWRIDNLNRLQMFLIALPDTSGSEITQDDIELNSLSLVRTEEPYSQISIQHGRNYTPMQADALASSSVIGATRHAALQQEWNVDTQTPVLTGYPAAHKQQFDTGLVNSADALSRGTAVAVIRTEGRQVWELTAFAPALNITAGQSIFITHSEYEEFANGRWVRVLLNERDLTGETCELEIWF